MKAISLETPIDLHDFKEIQEGVVDVFLQAMSGKFAKAAEDAKRHTDCLVVSRSRCIFLAI